MQKKTDGKSLFDDVTEVPTVQQLVRRDQQRRSVGTSTMTHRIPRTPQKFGHN